MEEVLRQFYIEVRHRDMTEAPLLTSQELALKAVITQCIRALMDAKPEELIRLIQVFRSEGLHVSEPTIRQEKFVAAATTLAFEPLTRIFGNL